MSVTASASHGRLKTARTVLGILMAFLLLGLFPVLLLRNQGEWWNWILKYSYSGFTQTKRDTMWFVTALSTLLAALVLILGGVRKVKWTNPARILGILFFGWMTLSMYYGSSAGILDKEGNLVVMVGSGRFEGMTTQLCYMLLMFAFSLQRPSMKSSVLFAGCALTFYAAVTFMQYAGGNPLGLYPRGRSIITNYEFQGTIGNIDMGAGFLSLTSALLLAYFVTEGGILGSVLCLPGLAGVLLLLMMGVQFGYIAIIFGGCMLGMAMICRPEMRNRGLVLMGLLLAVFVVRQLVGLPWVDGMKAPWFCEQRTDAVLPKLTGSEQVIFPWNPSLKKFLPLLGSAVLFAAAALVRKHPGHAIRAWVAWTVLILGWSVFFLCVWLIDVPYEAGGLWELHEIMCGRPRTTFGSERWGVWTHSLHVAKDNLLFGTGPDTFLSVMKNHLRAEGAALKQTFDTPHNMFIAILVQNGVPGLLLFIATAVCTLAGAAKRRRYWPLAAAVVCYLVQGFFSFSIVIVTPMFWAVLGMLMSGGEAPLIRVSKAAGVDDSAHELPTD